MRKSLLLAVLLATPGLVAAQSSQTDSKAQTKAKPGPTTSQESRGSALERARLKQAIDEAAKEEGDTGEADKASGKPEPDEAEEAAAEPSTGPKTPIGAKIYLTHDPAMFVKAWKAGGNSLPTTSRISQTTPVMVMMSVSGCAGGKDGKCAVTFTSRTAGPDGLFDKPSTSPPWKPEPMGNKAELAPASFGLRLGTGDPPGKYKIEVKVTDTIAKTSRTVTGIVEKPQPEGGR